MTFYEDRFFDEQKLRNLCNQQNDKMKEISGQIADEWSEYDRIRFAKSVRYLY